MFRLLSILLVVVLVDGESNYKRSQWRHWIDADGDCQDTRQEVLIRESFVPVLFETPRKCKVSLGEWVCPYTGIIITNPSDVDVDHVVALKDAHDSGAASWTQKQKQDYANSLVVGELAVTSKYGNRSKGSRGPDEWLPPLDIARCEYILNWVQIKERYGLDDPEITLINYMLRICENGQVPVLPQG
jgi:hypothetical protein